jgi:peptide/nickel transport system permease protein
MIPTLFIISVISFVIIQLPPGPTYMMQLRRQEYGSDRSMPCGTLRIGQPCTCSMVNGSGHHNPRDWGQSMEWQRPVNGLIWDRLALTIVLSLASV